MNTMLRWSPTRQFHFHNDNLFERFLGDATDEATQRPPWLPAAEGRIEDGTYVIQFALPGVDSKDVEVSLKDNVLTVKGERKADHDTADKTISSARSRTARSRGISLFLKASMPPKGKPSTRRASFRVGSLGRQP